MSNIGFMNQMFARNMGMGGMATGMDTEATIRAMMTASRMRLARHQQQRTIMNWRVEAYRGIQQQLSDFRNRNVGIATGGRPSLVMSDFWNSFNTTSSSNAITVRSTANSNPGNFTIDRVVQVATSQRFTTRAFEGDLSGQLSADIDASTSFTGQSISIQFGTNTQNIQLHTLSGLVPNTPSSVNADGRTFEEELQRLVTQAFGTRSFDPNYANDVEIGTTGTAHNVRVEISASGEISLHGHTSRVTVTAGNTLLGLNTGDSNRINLNAQIGSLGAGFFGGVALEDRDTFRFSINDTEITVRATETLQQVMSRINASAAGVNMRFDQTTQRFEITSQTSGSGDRLRIHDVEGNFMNALLGAPAGTQFNSDPIVREIGTITANGTDRNDAVSAILSRTLTSAADVDQAFTDLFAVWGIDSSHFYDPASTEDLPGGLTHPLTREEWNTLPHNHPARQGLFFDRYHALEQLAFNVRVNGAQTQVNFNLGRSNDGTDGGAPISDYLVSEHGSLQAAIMHSMNQQLDARLPSDANGTLAFSINGSGEFVLNSNVSNATIEFSAITAAGLNNIPRNALDVLGFTSTGDGADNNLANMRTATATGSATLDSVGIVDGSEFTITVGSVGPVTITVDASWTLDELANQINTLTGIPGLAGFSNGRFSIDSQGVAITIRDVDAAGNLLTTGDGVIEQLFGQPQFERTGAGAGFGAFDPATGVGFRAGQNAEVIINGLVVSSNSNTFEHAGTLFDLNISNLNLDADGRVIEALDGPSRTTSIHVSVTSDTDTLVDRIRDFIAEYNALIDSLSGTINERPNREYQPLTDEQRAEMTREEIERWEEQARVGLLSNDPALRRILTEMRNALFLPATHVWNAETNTWVQNNGPTGTLTLFDIGISTENTQGAGARNTGRLELTEAGERRLREMIENDPESVRAIFHNPPDPSDPNRSPGLAQRLDNVIQDAISTTTTSTASGHVVFRGSLVVIAGTERGIGNNDATLMRNIRNLDERISRQQARMETEFNRLWRRFAAMETAIARMSAQSGWLDQFTMNNMQ